MPHTKNSLSSGSSGVGAEMNVSMPIEEIFTEPLPTIEELELRYPPRELPENAMVTRVGPSPTGFMHIGTLYVAMLSERFARQTDGVFYLRLEDTDKKREVEGATDFIVKSLESFGIHADEGQKAGSPERGAYGPYTQSERKNIYHAFVKDLLKRGLAYPCFSTVEDLKLVHEQQEKAKVPPGYYGKWALWRDRSAEEVNAMLTAHNPYVIRFRSDGNRDAKIKVEDLVSGERLLPESDQDIVILKSDGLPTYHLAHVVDDHLMRTTHVIRGSEWLPSLPLHIQLFRAFNWHPPRYAHIMPIQKAVGSSKRKLSKRKDPEANIGYFDECGYPPEALIEYLTNLANPDFEGWRRQNPDSLLEEFKLTFRRLASSSGPLLDLQKLDDISKNVLSRFTSERLFQGLIDWAERYDQEFATTLKADEDYSKRVLSVERSAVNARKDFAKYSDIKSDIDYFFDESFSLTVAEATELLSPMSMEDAKKIVDEYVASYRAEDSQEVWFNKIKQIARNQGYADITSEYRNNPTAYKGNLAEMVKVFRALLTGRVHSPDLYAVTQALGPERMLERLALIK